MVYAVATACSIEQEHSHISHLGPRMNVIIIVGREIRSAPLISFRITSGSRQWNEEKKEDWIPFFGTYGTW